MVMVMVMVIEASKRQWIWLQGLKFLSEVSGSLEDISAPRLPPLRGLDRGYGMLDFTSKITNFEIRGSPNTSSKSPLTTP